MAKDNRALFVLLLPGVGFLLVMFGLPLAMALLGSFGVGVPGAKAGFSIAAYQKIFHDPRYVSGLATSLYYGLAPIIVDLMVAIPLSLALSRTFVGRKLFNGLYKIPLAIPSIVIAFAMLTLFEQGGFLSRLVAHVGLQLPRLVRDPWGIGVIGAIAWKDVPFMTLIITGSFAAVPSELVHAARALGASRLKAFALVMLPLSMPGITAAVLLVFIRSIGSFVLPDVLAASFPLPLSVLMYQAFRESNWPLVYAIGSILMAASLAVLMAYYLLSDSLMSRRPTVRSS